MKLGRIYYPVLWWLIRKTFSFWQRLGFHITPNFYYEPIPDTRKLDGGVWERETEMKGINLNAGKQLEFLDTVCSKYKKEYDSFGLHKPEAGCRYFVYNGYFGEIDGDVLYSMVRHYKPRKIVEIGFGYSTYLSACAREKNKTESGISADLAAIDPHPNPALKKGLNIPLELMEKKVQDVGLEYFESLRENDILFIDSTHVAKIDSDVCYEYLEIMPRLKKGVLIHMHDIFLPKEYPRDWVMNSKRFWNEAYLLQAFLMFNNSFEVIWAGSYMKLKYPEKCRELFRGQASHSFWIRKVQ